MPREQIHINLPTEHPVMSFETMEIEMAAVSAKTSIPRLAISNTEMGKIIKFYCCCFFLHSEPAIFFKHLQNVIKEQDKSMIPNYKGTK